VTEAASAPPPRASQWARYLKFNAVGALGFAVQLVVLALLCRIGVHYLVATACAVEVAVLHNFLWHRRWTFSDRAARSRAEQRSRLLRFHGLSGSVSLAGNLALMALLVGAARLHPLPANVLAIGACSILNYLASERIVFQDRGRNSQRPGFV